MQANKKIVQQSIGNEDRILASIRCSLKTFIYGRTLRPGILAATKSKLVFVGDSIEGNELTELYDYNDITEIKLKKGMLNRSISLRYNYDIIKFIHVMSNEATDFVDLVQAKISK